MEIRLGTLEENNGSKFQFLDSISIDEYKNLKKCILDIFNYSQNLKLLELVVFNERDVHNFIVNVISDIHSKSIKWNGVSIQDMDFYRIEANRFLLNYLSSFKTFLEHSETILKRKFGNNSTQIIDYKVMQSSIYDNNFSYRFFYKLRNYAQHCGLPLWFNYSTKKLDNSDEVEVKILIYLEKKQLLDSYDSWGTTKTDIVKLTDRIDFFPYFNETTNLIIDISEKFKTIIAKEIKNSAEYIKQKTNHLRTANNKVCIFSEIETDERGKLTNFVIEYMPYEIIDEIFD
jgi:hypothetical protein